MDTYTVRLEETWLDYPSPDDSAVAIILTGCSHNCPDCHSKHLQAFVPYKDTPEQILNNLKDYCTRAQTNKIVFLGGDPLHNHSLNLTRYLLDHLGKDYQICIFTGYDIEYVKTLNLNNVTYYKCGTFKKDLYQQPNKTDKNYILASRNQNFYDSMYKQLSKDGILTFEDTSIN